MKRGIKLAAVVFTAALAGCGTSSVEPTPGDNNNGPDASAQPGIDAAVPNTGQIPTWALLDVQPDSPRTGETYGLDEFNGKVLVALLVDGF